MTEKILTKLLSLGLSKVLQINFDWITILKNTKEYNPLRIPSGTVWML